MNTKAITLSIITASVAAFAITPAQAQEAGEGPKEGSARWHFPAHYYRLEQSQLPKGYGQPDVPAHSVSNGSVPRGNMFGLTPNMVAAKPATVPFIAPIAQTVHATPVGTTVGAKISTPPSMAAFANKLPAVPMVAQAPKPLTVPTASRPSAPTHATTGTHISWTPQHHHPVAAKSASAGSLPAIAGYGNQGYSHSGNALAPGASTGGFGSNASVSGTLINRHN